jgi:hypothetical protein
MKKIEMSTEECPVQRCRAKYKQIRARSEARSPKAFDAACAALLGDDGEGVLSPLAYFPPEAWVKAALEVTFMCRRCAGTGAFVTYVENGQPKGPGGACYRCAGSGKQSDADVMRNETHDRHYMARAAHEMGR